jgi:signal transduction histidine kinase
MSIQTRLALWFSLILVASLMLLIGVLHHEWEEQQRRILVEHLPPESAWHEVGEIVVFFGLPSAILLFVGGSILLRKSFAPVGALTRAAESIQLDNLRQRLPVSGNGDELDRLTEVFNAMMARLEGSVARAQEFTLNASHELKTPLTVMRSQLETALRDEAVAPAQREQFASLLEEIQRLTKIVNGLTFLARADAGQAALSLEPVRLDELVRDALGDAEALGRVNGIETELLGCPAVVVRADRHRLRQLLLNLTDNAIKYNHAGGRVTFDLARGSNRAQLTIANTGPGIPAEMRSRVFDRFYRGDPAHSQEIDGCGLGLSIVQSIVTAHGGEVAIDVDAPGWTAVRVSLPI